MIGIAFAACWCFSKARGTVYQLVTRRVSEGSRQIILQDFSYSRFGFPVNAVRHGIDKQSLAKRHDVGINGSRETFICLAAHLVRKYALPEVDKW